MQRANAALVEMSMSRPLYERLMAVRKAQIPPALRYMLNRQLGAYHRAGVDKDETTRKRIAELQNRINDGISSFDRNIAEDAQIGRAHVCTPVTNAHLVCRLLLEKQNKHNDTTRQE